MAIKFSWWIPRRAGPGAPSPNRATDGISLAPPWVPGRLVHPGEPVAAYIDGHEIPGVWCEAMRDEAQAILERAWIGDLRGRVD